MSTGREDQPEARPDTPQIDTGMAQPNTAENRSSDDHHHVRPAKGNGTTESRDSHSRRTHSRHDSHKASRSHNNIDAFKNLEKRYRELLRHSHIDAERHQQTKQELQAARLDSERLTKDGHAWQAATEWLKDQLAVTQKQLQQAYSLRVEDKKLLELRRVELDDAQAFLGSADTISGEEIASMVQALNSDIFQLAASITESGDFLDGYQCDEATIRDAEKRIGRDLSQLVYASRKQDHDRRELVIQIALQAALLRVCSDIVDSWVPSLRPTRIKAVYEAIENSCSQGSAVWESLLDKNNR